MSFTLLSKEKAKNILAEFTDDQPLTIQVSEDKCFVDDQRNFKWIDLGKVEFKKVYSNIQTAIQNGAFEWHTPKKEDLDKSIKNCLPENIQSFERMQKFLYQGFQDITRRLLLLLPTFDSDSLCRMPLKRPTTIVPDTSSVVQGGLDFVSCFLSPMARIKIPAVVHMEIENHVDNYFNLRYNKKNTDQYYSSALNRHLLSQGGQRTLLRLELHSEAEMDRGNLGVDPIRGIISPDSDPEDKSLGLTGVVKSFADRLILETARLHRSQVRPDHPLILLTSDQGMARMALSEGMDVFFFQARNAPDPFDKILTGTLFHPFKREFYTVSFTNILWELAVSFGGLKVINSKDDSYLELWALGGPCDLLPWQPLHAKDDLIWGHYQTPPKVQKKYISDTKTKEISSERFAPKGYKFSPQRMLNLIMELAEKNHLSYNEFNSILGVETKASRVYRRFLQSGQFIIEENETVSASNSLIALWHSISKTDLNDIQKLLNNIPSYNKFCSVIQNFRKLPIDSKEIQLSKFSLPNYIALGEMTGAIFSIPEIGIVSTDADPNTSEFVDIAFMCYSDIASKNDTKRVLTGEWLEFLASEFAIHPVKSRELLHKAKQEGLLDFFLEGSTPDNRFPDHTITLLELDQGKPILKKIFLYEGSFIKPGVAGVRIEIVRK
jgi:hypothetical protein